MPIQVLVVWTLFVIYMALSTIVEIIEALQTRTPHGVRGLSTIVEITEVL